MLTVANEMLRCMQMKVTHVVMQNCSFPCGFVKMNTHIAAIKGNTYHWCNKWRTSSLFKLVFN